MSGQLAIFAAALVVPVLVFVGILLWSYAGTERARRETETLEVAREVANLVDRDLAGLFATLDALAASPSLRTQDYGSFHREASELVKRQGIISILNDMDGQLLVNVRLPWGAPLPKTALPFSVEEAATGRPFITNAFEGRVSGRYLYAPAIGILRDGKPAAVLSFALEPDRLRKLFEDAGLSAALTVAVVDRNDRVVARSRDHDKFVGQIAGLDFIANARGREGTWSGTALDGTYIFGAYARSRLSDYRIGVGLPYRDLQAPLWRSLSLLAVLGAVVAALSTALGLRFANQITRPLEALSARAAALGRGDAIDPLASDLKEIDEVGRELASASASLRSRQAEILEANEEMQRFAYIVSHDLRSPLVNIMGFTSELEALRDDTMTRLEALRVQAANPGDAAADVRLGDDFAEAIGFIKASIGKMDRLINAILKLSREGRRDFQPERIDMNALMSGISASLAHQAEAADATIAVGRLPEVTGDRVALEQVFSNLLDNALKYLRTGVPGRIEVSARDTVGGHVYEVRDNGRGIDAKDRERVFELFRRSGVQDRPGEGIGLAHVRALVRRIGGTINLTSTPGQGSVFAVTLPRRWAAESRRKAA